MKVQLIVNLRASTSNKARKPLKSVENAQAPLQQASSLTKQESNDDEDEKYSLLDREESDDSFFSENEDNFIRESDVNENSNYSKENVSKRNKSASLKTKRALDEREKVVSTACLIM